VSSALAERLAGGRYIDVNIDRDAAARYGLNVADVHSVVTAAIGETTSVRPWKPCKRFPINVRYRARLRDSVEKIRSLPLLTERGAQIRLGDVAEVKITDGPPIAENRERAALGLGVRRHPRARSQLRGARHAARGGGKRLKLPAGTSISWSGQFEFLERATARLEDCRARDARDHLRAALFSRSGVFAESHAHHDDFAVRTRGRVLLMYVLGYNMSIASAVGFIALAGVAAEIGVVMLVYVNQAVAAREAAGGLGDERGFPAGHRGGSRAARAAGCHDGRRHHRGASSHHVRLGHRLGV